LDRTSSSHGLTYRELELPDAVELQRAVIDCSPLSLHTPYTYWVILTAGSGFCFGAWERTRLAAFALAIPLGQDRIFVWQLGVRPEFRGCQISHELLDRIWRTAMAAGLRSLETTIAPDNHASTAAFSSFADSHDLDFEADGDTTCQGPDGTIVDREVRFRLAAQDG
jgi:L-2,4-diaminobutyric acid acetyltransferase